MDWSWQKMRGNFHHVLMKKESAAKQFRHWHGVNFGKTRNAPTKVKIIFYHDKGDAINSFILQHPAAWTVKYWYNRYGVWWKKAMSMKIMRVPPTLWFLKCDRNKYTRFVNRMCIAECRKSIAKLNSQATNPYSVLTNRWIAIRRHRRSVTVIAIR